VNAMRMVTSEGPGVFDDIMHRLLHGHGDVVVTGLARKPGLLAAAPAHGTGQARSGRLLA